MDQPERGDRSGTFDMSYRSLAVLSPIFSRKLGRPPGFVCPARPFGSHAGRYRREPMLRPGVARFGASLGCACVRTRARRGRSLQCSAKQGICLAWRPDLTNCCSVAQAIAYCVILSGQITFRNRIPTVGVLRPPLRWFETSSHKPPTFGVTVNHVRSVRREQDIRFFSELFGHPHAPPSIHDPRRSGHRITPRNV